MDRLVNNWNYLAAEPTREYECRDDGVQRNSGRARSFVIHLSPKPHSSSLMQIGLQACAEAVFDEKALLDVAGFIDRAFLQTCQCGYWKAFCFKLWHLRALQITERNCASANILRRPGDTVSRMQVTTAGLGITNCAWRWHRA